MVIRRASANSRPFFGLSWRGKRKPQHPSAKDRNPQKLLSCDGLLLKKQVVEVFADSLLLKTQSVSFEGDSLVVYRYQKGFLVNAVLAGEFEFTIQAVSFQQIQMSQEEFHQINVEQEEKD